MKNFSVSLPDRLYSLVERHALLSGRSWEDEFTHGVMMYFDPEYAAGEMERVAQFLREQLEVSYEEESDDPDDHDMSEASSV